MEPPDKRLQPKVSNHELLDSPVLVPDDERLFTFRKLWAFSGPGLLMSIAFLDPGNISADLTSGYIAKYELLWVLFWAIFLGFLVQRLSARIGVVTGQHMAEVCYTEYRGPMRILIWIMMEIAIVGSDMQEVIGTSLAIHLISEKRIPLFAGALITVADTFLFIFLDRYGLRKLELFFATLIGVMAITFGFEFFYNSPEVVDILKGAVIPKISEDRDVRFHAVSIVGACVMPHNLYLHSGLVKTRIIDRSKSKKISEANLYFLIESGIALFISFIINLFVVSVFAKGLYGKSNADVYNVCSTANPFRDVFESTAPLNPDLYTGGAFLGCQFGLFALYIWSVGILAAGQSSTMTSCYAGQFTMEGFLNLSWVRWKRVLFTRSIALLPALYIASFNDLNNFASINTILNTMMSIQLPFAILPAVAFSSNKQILGEFANGIIIKIISVVIVCVLFGIIGNTVYENLLDIYSKWPLWLIVLLNIFACVYVFLVLYLIIHCAAALFSPNSWINKNWLMHKFILGKSMSTDPPPPYSANLSAK